MKILALTLAFITAAGVAGADTAKKPAKEEAPAADVAKFLALFDKIVDAVVTDKDDCKKMARDVSAVIDQNKDVIATANKLRKENKKLPAEAEKHVIAGTQKMVPAMAAKKCSEDADVQAAFKKLEHKD